MLAYEINSLEIKYVCGQNPLKCVNVNTIQTIVYAFILILSLDIRSIHINTFINC